MELFQVACTTCRAKLSIRNAELVGQIHACPKCGGMVEIAPPPGWRPAEDLRQAASSEAPLGTASASSIQSPAEGKSAASMSNPADDASSSPGVAVAPTEARLVRRVRLAAGLVVGCAAVGLMVWTWLSSTDDTSARPATSVAERPTAPRGGTAGPAGPVPTRDTTPAVQPMPPAADPGPSGTSPPVATPSPAAASSAVPAASSAVTSAATTAPLPAAPADAAASRLPEAGESSGLGAAGAALVAPSASSGPPALAAPMGTASLPTADAGPTPPAPAQAVFVPAVDVAARLADPLPAVEWQQITLAGLLETLHDLSTLEFSLDADACLARGVAPGRSLVVAAEATTVGELLNQVLTPLGLEWREVNRQLLITASDDPDAEPVENSYTLEPSAAAGTDGGTWLLAALPRLVEPTAWPANPAEGLVLDGLTLRVRQRPQVHRRIAEFLSLAAAVRGGRPDAAAKAVLARRRQRAAPLLAKPVQANFHEPTSLRKLVRYLERQTGGVLLVDGVALAAEGLSPDVPCRLTAQNEPLSDALAEITGQVHLVWRTIDPQTIEITTPRAAAARLELVWHPLEPKPTASDAAATVARLERVLTEAMPVVEPSPPWRPTVVIDPVAGGAWVLAPQAAQEMLAAPQPAGN